jgi:hypothetical protein
LLLLLLLLLLLQVRYILGYWVSTCSQTVRIAAGSEQPQLRQATGVWHSCLQLRDGFTRNVIMTMLEAAAIA